MTALPHRASASDQEREAAGTIAGWLRDMNLDPAIEEFRAVSSYSWELIGIALLFAAGVALGPFHPFIGTIFVVLGAWSFWRHFTGFNTLFSYIIPKKQSQNVTATIPSTGETKRTVVLMAHYDTARAALLWAPAVVKNFRQSFVLNAVLAFAAVPFTWLGSEWGVHLWYQIVALVLVVYFLAQVGIFIQRETVHSHVNGANDNGSGVAVMLNLAEKYAESPLEHTEIQVLATGCEESGMYGVKAFYNAHGDDLYRNETYFLNFDNVGAGTLNYCLGEGMLTFWPYDAEIVQIAKEVNQQPAFQEVETCRYRLAYFDTLPLVQEGYKCITCIGLTSEKKIPNWHWYSDTIENIDWGTINMTIAWGESMIELFDQGGDAS
ncbi:MAG: Zn-dependent exopeptidase M28 [Candidatus Marinimicrobia bacterium]|nr:Zn-dependent exopeptidase M28 [Candidatus Neomarinimicrobiota bacterium]MCF7829032.1 Zn-dependent exopeptidase M28 [Candidatus Neomarinimicrobiota bacterium]MCF7881831.1 Zn-dependent exopeptidase M28 [Candidatus Neomarinimicrobiota bacterium]